MSEPDDDDFECPECGGPTDDDGELCDECEREQWFDREIEAEKAEAEAEAEQSESP